MAKAKLTLDVALRTALIDNTQRGLARKLGVSPRTVGRWLRGESKPREPGRVMRKVSPMHYSIRRKIEAENATYTGADKIKAPQTAVPVLGHRAEINARDEYGRPTGEKILSDWVNFNVSRMDVRAQFDVLRALRERGAIVQLVYDVPAGGTSLGGREYARKSRAATGLIQLSRGMSDSELWEDTLAPLFNKGLKVRYIGEIQR